MRLKCRLLGHDYGPLKREERREDENGGIAVVDIKSRTCNRCGYTEEKRMRTRVIGEDSENADGSEDIVDDSESSSETQTDTEDKTQPRPEKSLNRTRDGNPAVKARDENADAGVILDSESMETQQHNNSYSPDALNTDGPEPTEDECGAIMLKKKEKEEDEPTGPSRIVSCDSCDYTKTERENSRRNGDMCPECGSWLTVRKETHD